MESSERKKAPPLPLVACLWKHSTPIWPMKTRHLQARVCACSWTWRQNGPQRPGLQAIRERPS
jgi:hypothetical protein